MNVIQGILVALQLIISLGFILLVMSQPTKNEGLGGNIGNPVTPNFKGKPGFEERMQGYTRSLGVTWFVISIAVAIAFRNG